MEQLLSNSTNQYLLPKEYKPFFDELGLDFNRIQDIERTDDLLAWNATHLKGLLAFYIEFHNAIQQKGLNATNATIPEGYNVTKINEPLVFEQIWLAEYD